MDDTRDVHADGMEKRSGGKLGDLRRQPQARRNGERPLLLHIGQAFPTRLPLPARRSMRASEGSGLRQSGRAGGPTANVPESGPTGTIR